MTIVALHIPWEHVLVQTASLIPDPISTLSRGNNGLMDWSDRIVLWVQGELLTNIQAISSKLSTSDITSGQVVMKILCGWRLESQWKKTPCGVVLELACLLGLIDCVTYYMGYTTAAYTVVCCIHWVYWKRLWYRHHCISAACYEHWGLDTCWAFGEHLWRWFFSVCPTQLTLVGGFSSQACCTGNRCCQWWKSLWLAVQLRECYIMKTSKRWARRVSEW